MPEQIPRSRYPLVALLCLGIALYIFYEGARNAPGLNSPPWVMYALALVWFAASARLVEMSLGNPGRGEWVAFIFCAGVGAAFASVPWDGHPEACSGGFSVALVGSNALGLIGGTNFCQRFFGAAGFFLIFLAIVIAWRWIVSRFGKKPSYY
jgi:hypothetical protein